MERAVLARRDESGRLHCADGPALVYPDNWSLFAWHGVFIPAWLVTQKHLITPETIECEPNAELRRIMLEIYGFDNYIYVRGAKFIAGDKYRGLRRVLYEIAGVPGRILSVTNGTEEAEGGRRQFFLIVPAECATPHEAVAWSYGRPAEIYSEALRT
jgi:hypothetical protein